MLTKPDLDQIRNIVKEEVAEQTSHLPPKEELYSKLDEIMGELKAMREEHDVQSYKVKDHEERITSLETIHPNSSHSG